MRLILERYLVREMAQTFFAVSLLLVLMFFSATFIRQLTETLEGDYPVSILFSLFALKAVGNIVFILPFAFFIALLLTFTRLYQENEIVVMHACGVGPRKLLMTVGSLGIIVAAVVGYLALFFAPWAEEKASQMLDEAGARQEIEGIIPGRFNSFGPNSPVVYVEKTVKGEKRLKEVFVQGVDEQGERYVMKARQAYEHIDRESGARYLVLVDGYRYEVTPGDMNYRITHFGEHGIRIQKREVVASSRRHYAVPTMELWSSDSPSDAAELHWRLATPISTLLLALLSVPLSRGSPRRGRYIGIAYGIVVYFIYNNLLTVGRSVLDKGEVPGPMGLWWVHLLLILLLVVLVRRQTRMPRRSRRARVQERLESL